MLEVNGSKRTAMLDPALGGMGGLSITRDGTARRYQHTVMAYDMPVASIVTTQDTSTAEPESNTSYLHVDRMGSVVMVTTSAGTLQSKTVFDAWGLRRSTTHGAVADPFAVSLRHSTTDRGYTEHQMLDDVGLIHMNARLYDPVLGRFLSADSIAPSPEFTQGLNRYSYVYNNPFAATDPSGHAPWWIVGIIIGLGVATKNAAIIQFGFNLIPGLGLMGAAMGGFVAGWVTTDGNFDAAVRGAVAGAFAAKLFGNVHDSVPNWGARKIAVHALVGGTFSAANGGDFKSGFVSAGLAQLFSPVVERIIPGTEGQELTPLERAGRAAVAATLGAIAAELSGGDPAAGALAAAMARLYNDDRTSQAKGKAAELDVERAIRRSGGRILATNIKFEVVDADGTPWRKANGAILKGELDGIYRDKFGTIHPYEVKSGAHAKFLINQNQYSSFVESGQIRFYGKQAIEAGLNRVHLWKFAGNGSRLGRMQLWFGKGPTSRRALSQFVRRRF